MFCFYPNYHSYILFICSLSTLFYRSEPLQSHFYSDLKLSISQKAFLVENHDQIVFFLHIYDTIHLGNKSTFSLPHLPQKLIVSAILPHFISVTILPISSAKHNYNFYIPNCVWKLIYSSCRMDLFQAR